MGTASAGYGFGNGVRVEAELSHRRNKVQSVENGNPALDRIDGRSSVTGFLGNVIYDIYTPSNFTPFVGVGAGAARVHAQNAGPDAQGNFVTGSEIVPAYQGLVGLNYQTSETVAVGITYRYFKAGDATLGSNPATKVTVPYKDKSLTVGLVYAFNPRVPVPTPAPRAATQRPVPVRGGEMLQDESPARPPMLQSSVP
jgi:opacity protein-like surface antigen